MKKILITLLSVAIVPTVSAGDKNYLRYVDPYIGAGGHGHVFVGACVPFGAVQIGPQNIFKGWDWCSGYHYSDDVLIGFSHTHLSGTGCTDLGDIQIMPFTGDVRTRRGEQDDISGSCAARYRHENERVSPYFYSLTLDNGIRAELTASRRVAFHKYTFPAGEEARLLINLREGNGFPSVASSLRLVDDHTVVGHRIVKGWAPEHRVYFALKSDRPIAELLVFDDDEPAGRGELEGEGVKGVVCFEGPAEELALKVAISSVSSANALENLRTEIPHWNFGKVMTAARDAWEQELERVDVTADERAKRIFYTAMYHTMIAPTTYCDANGEFRGHDNKIRRTGRTNYSTFSCWDTYRALHPWFTIIQSDRVGDMVASMLSICDQQGKLPIWPLIGGETNQMPGYGSVPIVSDAVVKGIRGIDAERALQCALQTAELREQDGIGYVLDREYIPADKVFEATSKAMEYAVADWGIAAMAHRLGREEVERTFSRRARYWRHYFDSDINFIRPKFDDGVAVHLLRAAGSLRTDRGHGRRRAVPCQNRFAVPRLRRHGPPCLGRHFGADRPVCPRQRTFAPRHLPLQLRGPAVENRRTGALRAAPFLHRPDGRDHRQRGLRTDVGMAYPLGAGLLPGQSLLRGLLVRQPAFRKSGAEYAQRPQVYGDDRKQLRGKHLHPVRGAERKTLSELLYRLRRHRSRRHAEVRHGSDAQLRLRLRARAPSP